MKKYFSSKYKNLLRYLVVGGICQVIDYFITIILFYSYKKIFLANSIGYIIGSSISYIGHTKFTFRSSSKKLRSFEQIIFFILACFLGVTIGYLIIKLSFLLEINIRYAKLIQLFLIALIQYIFNSRITFNKSKFNL